MTEGKENGDASKDVSDFVDAEMNEEIVEDKVEVEEEDKMSEEQVIEEEEANAHTNNKDPQSHKASHPKDATENEVNAVGDSENVDELHEEDPEYENNEEEEDKPKDSSHASVEIHSKIPLSDKSGDRSAKVNEKSSERNEESSSGPHDERRSHVISKGNDNVQCEKGAENSHAPGRDKVLDRSFAADAENLTIEVKVDENTTGGKMLIDNKENNDVSMTMENTTRNQTFMFDDASEGSESGTEEEQSTFMRELENFCREKNMDFKAPKFYGVPLNLIKLWRAVIKLGGYDKVTACKLWRQVGESFNPPKTCTTVSFTFRIFYEKALLEYERHKIMGGELNIAPTVTEPVGMESPALNNQASGSGRARRDAAARAMQGWHSHRIHGNDEVNDPIIKDKGSIPLKVREKHLKNIGGQKQKKPLVEPVVKVSRSKLIKGPSDTAVPVIDVGPAADWVKINVRTTKDCYEVYALVPGLLREEVRVQSDPAGRLVISGEPEHPDNPWGVTPFKKVVSLPSRIDPQQTSAVVTLHGQLFIRVPFEQSD